MLVSKRDFLKFACVGTGLAAFSGVTSRAEANPGVVDVFFNSDSNVVDFWIQHIKPDFEAEHPGIFLNLVPGGGGAAMNALAGRAFAAFKSGKEPQIDVLEAVSPLYPQGGLAAGLWVDFKSANLSNYKNINPVVRQFDTMLPYRGSQVVLMYNSDVIKDVPLSFEALVAWIKDNPGKFTYARPDVGDSGAQFVARALQEVTGQEPDLFLPDNYSEVYANPMFSRLWPLLQEIQPFLFKGGDYTSGNTESIQLLANGAIAMTVAWSDMALIAMNEGVVPPTTSLAQLQDLAFGGGYSGVIVPTIAANKEAAIKLANYIISPKVQTLVVTKLGGFPSVRWDVLSPALQSKFSKAVPKSIPEFPASWEPALFEGWYRHVAGALER